MLLKECTIEAEKTDCAINNYVVSVVIERMYDWSFLTQQTLLTSKMFQLLLKECTIEATKICLLLVLLFLVSVVIERMYDWSTWCAKG